MPLGVGECPQAKALGGALRATGKAPALVVGVGANVRITQPVNMADQGQAGPTSLGTPRGSPRNGTGKNDCTGSHYDFSLTGT